MKLKSATILRSRKKEIRAINDPCDPACLTWHACANSKPDGTCEGFILMNGQTRKHLNRIINEDDGKYIENCVRTIQRGVDTETEEGLVREVLRYIAPQPTQRPSGISYMAQCALGVSGIPTQENAEPEPNSNSTFTRMLEASSKGKKPAGAELQTEHHPLIQRQIDFESQLPEHCSETCPISRHCSSFPSNKGHVCIKLSEQYKNERRVSR